MLTLYDYPFSGNGYRVRLALRELEIRFKYQRLDILKGETQEPWFLAKNPAGQIPLLELDDGSCIPESTAILFFLAEGTHLLPADKLERTRVLQWMCFEQTNVDGVISRARFRRQFPDVIPTRPEEFDVWLREGARTLGVMEEHLRTREFFVGDSLSIADLALYSYVHRAEEGGFDLSGLRALQGWFERIERRPRHISIDTLPEAYPHELAQV
jgi:glutathione S-transferase